MDPPASANSPAALLQTIGVLPRSDQAAMYYPWVRVALPTGGAPILFPPSGAVAGIFAATDQSQGVWKAPAGSGAALKGVLGPATPISEADAARLSAANVNPLRTLPGVGNVIWGSRTFLAQNSSSDYKYVPVRRLALFIEQSVDAGTQWAVFEPNNPRLWSKLKSSVGAFMQGLFRQGAFQGSKPSDAYFVKCDKTTMTQADIDQGKVIVVVGFAPVKPAEFVIFRIGLWTKKP
ncbi:MAG TPA: phage tail sheath C-terminal domain-containing protein, partial [Fimbriimonadaceae bacterium]|nr:phage tail sheath C-terminal domain-containing protein [Fimbriimonadaceae bacterium]